MICVVSALLAAAFAYISPALADEASTDAQSMSPTPNSTDQNQNNPPDNSSSSQDNSSNTTTNDQSTPDTPAGDDDY